MKSMLFSFSLLVAAAQAGHHHAQAPPPKGRYLRKHICGGLPLEAVGPCRVYEALGCVTRRTDDDCKRTADTFLAIYHQPLPQLMGCDNDEAANNGQTVIDFQ